jgi:NAD+ synthase (glutamine-hydrolysing)
MTDDRFFSIHAQGLVRVAAATPAGSAGDPAANAASILDLARRGHDQSADLIVIPNWR